ncbi:hypothetical protein H310_12215 [Aphanomyces invadans]|uniref:Uncharacterized protein n=1 Tax=Aphanomyces invadans TaxID=157072 RepID=A0A024TII8_9STRA|nr:hypothetical protein H310_12215 [Aphanomyces invadans]ETV93868.1 hypothetical protein H310_12215 [Aphanomyces invadans]|eukprot:XP_008877428.1 hypothetical protein H310_12215 [Aphanomyces invadans]
MTSVRRWLPLEDPDCPVRVSALQVLHTLRTYPNYRLLQSKHPNSLLLVLRHSVKLNCLKVTSRPYPTRNGSNNIHRQTAPRLVQVITLPLATLQYTHYLPIICQTQCTPTYHCNNNGNKN